MPDRTTLKVGDTIRLLRVPDSDLRQRERELLARAEDAGSTADAIERIIQEDPVVTIAYIERDMPWFERTLKGADGTVEYHSLAIMDDDSWEWMTEATDDVAT